MRYPSSGPMADACSGVRNKVPERSPAPAPTSAHIITRSAAASGLPHDDAEDHRTDGDDEYGLHQGQQEVRERLAGDDGARAHGARQHSLVHPEAPVSMIVAPAGEGAEEDEEHEFGRRAVAVTLGEGARARVGADGRTVLTCGTECCKRRRGGERLTEVRRRVWATAKFAACTRAPWLRITDETAVAAACCVLFTCSAKIVTVTAWALLSRVPSGRARAHRR